MVSLVHVSKVLFCAILICICLIGFGWPSLEKFLARKVSIEESMEENNGLKSPAISICPNAPAWKSRKTSGFKGNIKRECQNEVNAKGFRECVEKKAYSIEDLVRGTRQGLPEPGNDDYIQKKIINDSQWIWDMYLPGLGRCYTFQFLKPLTFNMEKDSLVVFLNPNMSYIVAFHELDFFTLAMNPLALPMLKVEIKPTDIEAKSIRLYTLQVIFFWSGQPSFTFVKLERINRYHQRDRRYCRIKDKEDLTDQLTHYWGFKP